MNNSDSRTRDPELSATDKPSGGGMSEDWWATVIGLSLAVLALLGFVPKGILW
jgi:hypothetical protein